MRVGILGGTFDPPHLGHIALARAAIVQLRLDEVMLLPASRNPLKQRSRTSAKDRLEMVRFAILAEPELSASDIEIERGGPSYAVDTLQELTYVRPGDYWFILGSDALRELPQWKQPARLLKLCRLAVVLRGKESKERVLAPIPEFARDAVDWVEMSPLEISSTEIRQRIEEGRPVAEWMNKEVLKYIEKNGLYSRR